MMLTNFDEIMESEELDALVKAVNEELDGILDLHNGRWPSSDLGTDPGDIRDVLIDGDTVNAAAWALAERFDLETDVAFSFVEEAVGSWLDKNVK